MVVEFVFEEKPPCGTRPDASRQVIVDRPGRVQMWARSGDTGTRAPLCEQNPEWLGDAGRGL